MLGEGKVAVRSRENRSWGYEVHQGHPGLLEQIAQGEGMKPVPMIVPHGKIGTIRVSAEKRGSVAFNIRMNIKAWVSEPVVYELSEQVKARGLRLHKVIQRLIRMKENKFKEPMNGPAQN